MAQPLAHALALHRHAGPEKQRRMGMAEVVQGDDRQTGARDGPVEHPAEDVGWAG